MKKLQRIEVWVFIYQTCCFDSENNSLSVNSLVKSPSNSNKSHTTHYPSRKKMFLNRMLERSVCNLYEKGCSFENPVGLLPWRRQQDRDDEVRAVTSRREYPSTNASFVQRADVPRIVFRQRLHRIYVDHRKRRIHFA